MVYKSVCGVQGCVWCTRGCVVYKGMCGVQGGVWCTKVCVVYQGVCGVQGNGGCAIHIDTVSEAPWITY